MSLEKVNEQPAVDKTDQQINFFSAPYFSEIESANTSKYSQQSFNYNYNRNTFQPEIRKDISGTESMRNDTESQPQTKKENNSEMKNDTSIQENLLDFYNYNEKNKAKKSLLPDLLKKKINSRRTQIIVYFFNTQRKLTFQKAEINRLFQAQENPSVKIVKNLIPLLMKSFCRLFQNFQAEQISAESFQLKLANLNNQEDELLDSISPEQNISFLYDANNLILVRKKRSKEKLLAWQNKLNEEKADIQILEILIPFRRELMEKIEPSKTIQNLKDKNHTLQQLGKIIIVEYSTMKVCDPKKKIMDIPEKVLEAFKEKTHVYDDRPIKRNLKQQYPFLNEGARLNARRPITQFQPDFDLENSDNDLELEISDGAYFGKLSICIKNTAIFEKYEGGLLGFLFNPYRNRERSIHNLVGIANGTTSLKLKFMYKNRSEFVSYQLKTRERKETLMKHLLRLGRTYNKNFSKIK